MLNIKKLEKEARLSKGKITLLTKDRVTIVRGLTSVDLHQLTAFDPQDYPWIVAHSPVSLEQAEGWCIYNDPSYHLQILVDQKWAEDLAKGCSFPQKGMPERELRRFF